MSAHSGVEIAPWEAGDEHAICRLFERTFARPKNPEHWRWQFLGQGLQPPVMLAHDAAGEVIAHFGAVPLRGRVGGRAAVFGVAVDNMVTPERRQGLQRRGLFADVVERWVEHFCEQGELEFGYGLGNSEVTRIGRRLLGFREIEGSVLLARRLAPESLEAFEAGESLARVAAGEPLVGAGRLPPADHDALWERSPAQERDGLIRDARFLRWRFSEAPGADYEFLGVRRRGQLAVTAVLTPSYVVPDAATLVELIWDGADTEDLTACLRGAEARAHACGLNHLALLLPAASPEAQLARSLGYGVVQSGLALVGRAFGSQLVFEDVAPQLHYSFADFDLM